MKKIAYLECPTGIAGDMCLGALVDAGVPLEYLAEKLKSLGIESEYRLWAENVHHAGQKATKVQVELLNHGHHHHDHDHEHHHHPPARHLPEITQLIKAASLPPRVTNWSLEIFQNLAIAEGTVHGLPPEKVHFHEVGATDALIDIIGTCLGLDWLGIEALYCSALPTGGGTVKAAHGILSVPVPAVLKLWELRQVPVYSNGINRELVTPTGAAIAVTLAEDFGTIPAMQVKRVGFGAGTASLPIPNILRLWLGQVQEVSPQLETVTVLETQIDDLTPQTIAYTTEILLQAGALDVFTQAITMKKSRQGILLTVICHPDQIALCEEIIFRETTTLGIRRLTQERSILDREIEEVNTEYGKIRVKVASQGIGKNRQIINVQPEYEDCAAIARNTEKPLRLIQELALEMWQKQN